MGEELLNQENNVTWQRVSQLLKVILDTTWDFGRGKFLWIAKKPSCEAEAEQPSFWECHYETSVLPIVMNRRIHQKYICVDTIHGMALTSNHVYFDSYFEFGLLRIIDANGGGFVSKSRLKDYFATARIACPKVQVGQPKSWESLPFWQTLKRVMKSPKYSLLALFLGGTPSQRTSTWPPSCLLLENRIYITNYFFFFFYMLVLLRRTSFLDTF